MIAVTFFWTILRKSFNQNQPPYPNSNSSYLSNAFDTGKLVDTTIKTADGNEIKANKFILSRSPVFDAMLNRHDTKEAQESLIEITDINYEVLKEMIRYMYSDEILKLKEMALDLMIAANKYALPGLFEICKEYLKKNITNEGMATVLTYAHNLKIDDLEKAIMEHNDIVLASDEWQFFEKNHIEIALKVIKHCFHALKELNNTEC